MLTCPRRSFTEVVGQVPARHRLTTRLRAAAGFTAHAAVVLPVGPDPVTVLGIDETRRGRPKWVFDQVSQAWQTSVDRWHVGMCDLSGGQGLLGQVEGRNAQVVADWLGQRSQAWRDAVRFVAIDMCTIFKSAISQALPQGRDDSHRT